MDEKLLVPIITGAIVLWAVFRRVRRNIGRQPVQPGRMKVRIGLFVVVGALTALFTFGDGALAGSLLAGTAAGGALGWFGLRHTQFETVGQDRFYTPHTYIGLFVSALFIGRIVYRFLTVYPALHAASQAQQDPLAEYQKSPATLAILGVVIGYYVVYYIGVLRAGSNSSLSLGERQ